MKLTNLKLLVISAIMILGGLKNPAWAQNYGNPIFLQNGQSQMVNGTPVFCGMSQPNPVRELLLDEVYSRVAWFYYHPKYLNIQSEDGQVTVSFVPKYSGSTDYRVRIQLNNYPFGSGTIRMISQPNVGRYFCNDFKFADDQGNSLQMRCDQPDTDGQLVGTLIIR